MAVPKSRPAGRRRFSREAAAADFREADQAAVDQVVAADQPAHPAVHARAIS